MGPNSDLSRSCPVSLRSWGIRGDGRRCRCRGSSRRGRRGGRRTSSHDANSPTVLAVSQVLASNLNTVLQNDSVDIDRVPRRSFLDDFGPAWTQRSIHDVLDTPAPRLMAARHELHLHARLFFAEYTERQLAQDELRIERDRLICAIYEFEVCRTIV